MYKKLEELTGAAVAFFASMWQKGMLVAHNITVEDIKSVILSVLSAVLGYLAIQLVKSITNRFKKEQK